MSNTEPVIPDDLREMKCVAEEMLSEQRRVLSDEEAWAAIIPLHRFFAVFTPFACITLIERIARLTSDLAAAITQGDKAQIALTEAIAQTERWRVQANQYHTALAKSQNDLAAAKLRVEGLERQTQVLLDSLNSTDSARQKFLEERDALITRLAGLIRDNQASAAEQNEANLKLRGLAAINRACLEEVVSIGAERDEAQKTLAEDQYIAEANIDLHERLTVVEAENADLKARVEQLSGPVTIEEGDDLFPITSGWTYAERMNLKRVISEWLAARSERSSQ